MPINPLGFNNKSHNNGNNKEVSKKYLLYQNEGDSLVLSNKKHSKQTLINKFKNKFFKKQGCEISFGNSTNNAKEPKTEAQIALSKYGLDFENYPDLELQFESEIHDLMKIAEQNNIEYSVIAQVGQIINEDNTMHLLDFVPKMATVAVEVSNGTGFNIEDCAYLVKEYRDDLDAMQKPIRLMSEYKISGKDSTQISTNFRLRDQKADEAAMLVRDSKISGDDAGEIILNAQDEAEKEEIIKFIKDNEVSAQCAIELKEKFIDDNEKYITDAAKVTKEGFASVDTVLSLFKEFGDDIEKIKFAVGVINLNACDIESAVNATHLHFNEGYEEKDAYQVAKYFKSRDKKLSQVERLQKEYEVPAGICAQAISLSEENEIEPEKLIDVLIAIEKHPHRLPMALDMLKENAEPKDVAKIISAVYENEIQLFNCKNILQKYELSANEALFFTRKFEKELECNPEAANRQIENIINF